MAKAKQDKKLYSKMRDHGLRKRIARELSELPAHVSNGKQAPKPLREAVDRLEGLVQELKSHTSRGDRKTAARKAARTRSQNAASRSTAARKAARTRAKASRSTASGGSRSTGTTKSRTSASAAKTRSGATATKSRTSASAAKTRSGASAAKSRSGASTAKPRARRSTRSTGQRRARS